MRNRAVGAVLALSALLAGCTVGSDEEDPDRSGQAVPMSHNDRWDSERWNMGAVDAAAVHDDTVVVLGRQRPDGMGAPSLVAADADSGEPRWAVNRDTKLSSGDGSEAVLRGGGYGESERLLTLGSGDEWSVLVTYTVGEGEDEEVGVAALSGTDGSLRWKKRLPNREDLRLLDTERGTVLVGVVDAGGWVDSYALDASDDGRQLWRHKGEWVYALDDGVAMGQRLAFTDEWTPFAEELPKGGSVFALDARTGDRRWDLRGRYEHSQLVGAESGRAVVEAGYEKKRLLDSGSGRAVGKTRSVDRSCADDGRGMLACVPRDALSVLTLRPGDGDSARRVKKPETRRKWSDLSVAAVHGSQVIVNGSMAKDDDSGPSVETVPRALVLDSTGASNPRALPGRVAAASGKYAATIVPRGGERLVVHSLRDGERRKKERGQDGGGVRPVSFAKDPEWGFVAVREPDREPDSGIREVGLSDLIAVELLDDTLLYSGVRDADDHQTQFTAVNVDTGKKRWSLRKLGDGVLTGLRAHHVVVGSGRNRTLLMESLHRGGRQGVSAVSLDSGEVRWARALESSGEESVRLRGAGQRTFVTTVENTRDGRVVSQQTRAYDVRTGKPLWSRDGTEAIGMGRGTVLGHQHDVPYERRTDDAVKSEVVALDARTGKERWTPDTSYRNARVETVAGERAVVMSHSRGSAVLDPATGKELVRSVERVRDCEGSAEPLVVCGVSDELFSTVFSLGQGGATARVTDLEPGLMGEGHGWFTYEGESDSYAMRDERGRVIAKELPGAVLACDKRHVVAYTREFRDRTWDPGLRVTVHRRERDR